MSFTMSSDCAPRYVEYVSCVPFGLKRETKASVRDSISFMEAITGSQFSKLRAIEFFTSHEALALDYEMAQTREVPRRDGWYNLSTHFPWIGVRTSDPDAAHVEYFRGIRNPIAVKVGLADPGQTNSATASERLERLLDILHPDDEPGRLTLIHRFGAHHIARALPPLIEVVHTWSPGAVTCTLCRPKLVKYVGLSA